MCVNTCFTPEVVEHHGRCRSILRESDARYTAKTYIKWCQKHTYTIQAYSHLYQQSAADSNEQLKACILCNPLFYTVVNVIDEIRIAGLSEYMSRMH